MASRRTTPVAGKERDSDFKDLDAEAKIRSQLSTLRSGTDSTHDTKFKTVAVKMRKRGKRKAVSNTAALTMSGIYDAPYPDI
jgi:hypothetical protein